MSERGHVSDWLVARARPARVPCSTKYGKRTRRFRQRPRLDRDRSDIPARAHGAVALEGLRQRGRAVHGAARVFCTIDHIVDTRPGRTDATSSPSAGSSSRRTRAAAQAAGIRLFDVGDRDQGIVHVISPELGLACRVSPSSVPTAIPAPRARSAPSRGGSVRPRPSTPWPPARCGSASRRRCGYAQGRLGAWVGAKDLSLRLSAATERRAAAARRSNSPDPRCGHSSMEARFTLCNMATEFVGCHGMIAPDDTTFDYLAGRDYAPRGAAWDQALAAGARCLGRRTRCSTRRSASMSTISRRWSPGVPVPQHASAVTGTRPRAEHSGTSQEAHARALQYMDLRPGQA